MIQSENYIDYRNYIINTLKLIILWTREYGIFDETLRWLTIYGKYNPNAVEYLKKNKIFSEEEFLFLDKISEIMEYYDDYEDLIGNIYDVRKSAFLNHLREQGQETVENLAIQFLSLLDTELE